jgi:predicted enzyme related to lactoylglutathione lyase
MGKRDIVHIEIPAVKSAEAAAFYSELFGWDIQQDDNFDYIMFSGGNIGGGFTHVGENNTQVGDVLVYVGSDDIDADLKAITAKGGEVVMPKSEIPTIGWFAVFKDPTGNAMALYTAMNPAG